MVSGKKRLKNIQQKERKRLIAQQVSLSKFPWRWIAPFSPKGNFCAWLVLILTVVGSYYTLSPKISITASELLDPSKPFSAPFIISNESILPIHSVTFKYRHYVKSEGGGSVNVKQGIPGELLILYMAPGEKFTTGIPFPFEFTSPISYADVQFFVIYRPDWLPWHGEQRFRFGLAKKSNGSWTWLPRAMSE